MDETDMEISNFPDIAAFGFQMVSVGKSKFFEFVAATISTSSSDTDLTPSSKKRWLHQNNNNHEAVSVTENKKEPHHPANLHHKIILPEFTLDDVSFHDTPLDCWVAIYDQVYDITTFLQEHPGGDEVMLEYAGRDATLAFRSVGHTQAAEDSLKQYRVGVLVEEDRIWSRLKNWEAVEK